MDEDTKQLLTEIRDGIRRLATATELQVLQTRPPAHDARAKTIAAYVDAGIDGLMANLRAGGGGNGGGPASLAAMAGGAAPTLAAMPGQDLFPLAGPAPDFGRANAVLVASSSRDDAVNATQKWSQHATIGGRAQQSSVMDSEEARQHWTKLVRANPDVFRQNAGPGIMFVAAVESQPHLWMPAFDVVVQVRRDASGALVYALLKGQRVGVGGAAAAPGATAR